MLNQSGWGASYCTNQSTGGWAEKQTEPPFMWSVWQSDHRRPGVDRWGSRPTSHKSLALDTKSLLISPVHVSFWIMTHTYHWDKTVLSRAKYIQQGPYFLYLQLTWSPKSITIMWGRRGSLIHPVTNPRLQLHLLPPLQRLRRASQRTLVLLLPQTAVKPLRTLLKTTGQHTRKYLWLFKSCADSTQASSFRFPPLFCTNRLNVSLQSL